MLNRALFDRIRIDDEDYAALEPEEVIQTILATNPRPQNERTLPCDDTGQGSNVLLYVELRGLEPLTPCMPCRCATSCAIAPWLTLETLSHGLWPPVFRQVLCCAAVSVSNAFIVDSRLPGVQIDFIPGVTTGAPPDHSETEVPCAPVDSDASERSAKPKSMAGLSPHRRSSA